MMDTKFFPGRALSLVRWGLISLSPVQLAHMDANRRSVFFFSDIAPSFLEANMQRTLLWQEERDAMEASFGPSGLYVGPFLKRSPFFIFVEEQLHAGIM